MEWCIYEADNLNYNLSQWTHIFEKEKYQNDDDIFSLLVSENEGFKIGLTIQITLFNYAKSRISGTEGGYKRLSI